ncbi:MAG: GNAT family N-acetyltransferase [Thermoleophilia bacterium]|nr:GNAT family N-acetyltransferase [Thermoleophilia bacterium]
MEELTGFRTTFTTRDGRDLVVRAIEPADMTDVYTTMSEPSVVFGTFQVPYTSHETRNRTWPDRTFGPNNHFLGAELDGKIVGNAGLHLTDGRPRGRHVAGLGMSVSTAYQGLGIGTALMSALVELADDWLQIRRIELSVNTDNEAGIALYTKHGFEIEGTQREVNFRKGKYVDCYSMARLSPRRGPAS